MQRSMTSVSPYAEKLDLLSGRLGTVIRGKDEVIRDMVIALVAGGSVLIEDVPGVGKTTLAKTLANSVGLDFNRVQSTPDLLPSDFFGFSVLNPQIGEFTFRSGPIFCNLLLVDEINRASPRTQAALLEAMAERQVTIEGTRHELERPFLVLATQNPAEHRGTFPLPESQLDRFLFQLSMNYPDHHSEIEMLYGQAQSEWDMTQSRPVLSKEELLACHSLVREVYVERTVADYMVRIARRTREHDQVVLGSSPRATLMIFQASQGKAFLEGRDHVLPDDVQHVTPLVLRHRLMLARGGAPGTMEADEIIAGILRDISVPV